MSGPQLRSINIVYTVELPRWGEEGGVVTIADKESADRLAAWLTIWQADRDDIIGDVEETQRENARLKKELDLYECPSEEEAP